MADISVADLQAFTDQIEANDIFSQIAQPLIGFKPQTLTVAPGDPSVGVMPKVNYINPFEQLATSFGTSLLGGLAANYGKQKQAEQLASLTSILPNLISDPTSVKLPEGMDSGAFDIIKQKLIAADVVNDRVKEEKKTEKQDERDFDTKKLLLSAMATANTPEARDRVSSLAKELGLVDKDLKTESSGGSGKGGILGLESIPKSLKDNAMKELGDVKTLEGALSFVDQKFDQAKSLLGPKAGLTSMFGVPTDEGNQLSSLAEGLVFQIDNLVGREVNSDVRARFLQAAPKWYDTEATVEKKKKDFKDLLSSLKKQTPILDAAGLSVNLGKMTQQPQTKTVGGKTYKKVPGGWLPIG